MHCFGFWWGSPVALTDSGLWRVCPHLCWKKVFISSLFPLVPCRASITYSHHFHVTSVFEAPYPLLLLIICCYGGWSCSSSGRSRSWDRPGSSIPTVAGFSWLYFVPALPRHLLPFISPVPMYHLSFASRYLAASPSCFHCFPSFGFFRFASFVAAY